MHQRGILIRSMAVLFGLLILLSAYYWVHKPINIPLILTLGGALLDVLTPCMLVSIAGGVGRRLLTRFDYGLLLRPERIALEAMFGLGLLAISALLMGLVGLFKGVVLWPGLLLVAIVVRRELWHWLADCRALWRQVWRRPTSWERFLVIVLALLLLTALLRALTPPATWDALTYHLVIPARYVTSGRITTYLDNHNMGFPQAVELLYGTLLSLLGRDTALAPLHWLFGVFALLATAGLARRYSDPATGLLAAILLMSGISLWWLLGEPYVDLAVMAYSILIVVLLLAWRETQRPLWLALTGVGLGLAFGVKYTVAPLALACGIFVAVYAPRQIIRNGLILSGFAALAFAPWLLKGLLLYQNPIYPFIFGGPNWDSLRAAQYATTGRGLLGTANIWQIAVLPLAATIFGVEGGAGFSFTSGPWLLTAPLLLIPTWRWLNTTQKCVVKALIVLDIPLLIFWAVMAALAEIGAQTRLMIMLLPVSAVSGALAFYGISRWPPKPLNLSFMLRAILVVTLALMFVEASQATVGGNYVPYLAGTLDRDEFLNQRLGGYIDAMRHLKELPPDATVRLMWEPRGYYCPVHCLADVIFDQWTYPLQKNQTPDEVFQNWQQAGDRYLLLWDQGYDFALHETTSRVVPLVETFKPTLLRWMTPIWSNNAYTLYTWKHVP